MKHRFFAVIGTLFLFSCGGPHSCVQNFSELKTNYPHVIYHGPKEPTTVEIKKYPPASWVSLSQISKEAQWAILVSEDWAFYQHQGYDGKQIRDAIEKSIEEGKLKRGASTITQQVVRNIYLTKNKSIVRKLKELFLSTKIEKALGKKKILELYFNIAEWGEGIFGIEPAARLYFNKTPSALSAKEGAYLAMLLPSPKKYSISYRQHELTPFARKTMRSILGKMVQAKILTLEEMKAEWIKPLSFEKNTANLDTIESNSLDTVPDELIDDENVIDDESNSED